MATPFSNPQIHAPLARALGLPLEALRRAFRMATARDIPQILELRRLVRAAPTTWDDEKYWRWKYLEQPDTSSGEIPCWVFEKGPQIIGAMGFERIHLCINGSTYPAVWSYDIMVRPDYEGRGLGVLMNQVFQDYFPLLLVVGTNERSTRMLERLFTPLPPLRLWKKVLRTRPILERYLKSKRAAPVMAAALDPLLSAADFCNQIRVPPDVAIRPLKAFNDQADVLCDRVQSRNRVLVRRHKEYLNWRFLAHPRRSYDCYGAFLEDRLHGYIVTHLTATDRNTIGVIVDWLCDEGEQATRVSLMRLLLQHSIAQLGSAGADVIYTFAYQPSVEEILRRLWFIRDPRDDIPFFLGACPDPLREHLLRSDNWILTKGDSDIG